MGEKVALIIGSTGMVGLSLTEQLLACNDYAEVRILGRSKPQIVHEKLQFIPAQLTAPGLPRSAFLNVNDIFCCIGTTTKKTPNKEEYANIDREVPAKIAEIGKIFGVERFLVVSSIGASATSKFFYLRVKGEMEEKVIESGIPVIEIFRPSTLLGKRKEFRPAEYLSRLFDPVTRYFVPKKYRGIKATTVAHAMLIRALSPCEEGINVWESDQIDDLIRY